jgi:hypothetical protein
MTRKYSLNQNLKDIAMCGFFGVFEVKVIWSGFDQSGAL